MKVIEGLVIPTERQDPIISIYRKKLHDTIDAFLLDRSHFTTNIHDTIQVATRLLHGLQIDPIVLDDPICAAFTLAIADSWIHASFVSSSAKHEGFNELGEKRGLLNALKFIARDDTVSFSGTVRRASQAGRYWGRLFDPQAEVFPHEDKNESSREQMRIAIKSTLLDTGTTQALQRAVDRKGPGTLLHRVRKFFDRDGTPIRVAVLRLTEVEMAAKYKLVAVYEVIDGNPYIIFSSGHSKSTLEHEFMHHLGGGPSGGYFFAGIDEAWVMEHESEPEQDIYIEDKGMFC